MMDQQKNALYPSEVHSPMEVEVKIYRPSPKGPVLADASVTLNGCFAIRGIQIREGKNGPFVSMPSRQVKGEYRDVCFPCTKEFKQDFDRTVLEAYQMELRQKEEPVQAGPVMGGLGM